MQSLEQKMESKRYSPNLQQKAKPPFLVLLNRAQPHPYQRQEVWTDVLFEVPQFYSLKQQYLWYDSKWIGKDALVPWNV